MKIAICGDVHLCKYSSILRKRGKKFSARLENCIDSLNWFEQVAAEQGCDMEVFLGDFFDASVVDDETITAIKDIKWNPIHKIFLVGNHESSVNGLRYNTTNLLKIKDSWIADTHQAYQAGDLTLAYIPYIIEKDRKPLGEYLPKTRSKKTIVFSHNDIKDFQMGAFKSVEGFAVSDIEANCDLFINGHLHNAGMVTKKIINVGNLTGQNFSEDAEKYDHHIMILDIDKDTITYITNPHSLKFYKLTVDNENDLSKFDSLKNNAVVTVSCNDSILDKVTAKLKSTSNVLESRVVSSSQTDTSEVKMEELRGKDHLEQFENFILDNMGDSQLVKQELEEVLR